MAEFPPLGDGRLAVTPVVGVVISRDNLVLAARKPSGDWEFPGGKAEPGETLEAAAIREIDEELGCTIVVDEVSATKIPINGDLQLHLVYAHIDEGEPQAREHTAIRWVAAADLDQLNWTPIDCILIPEIAGTLAK